MTISKEQNFSVKTYDTRNYVADSAVFFLDAVENAGYGNPHDNQASAWVDLSPDPSNQNV